MQRAVGRLNKDVAAYCVLPSAYSLFNFVSIWLNWLRIEPS